MQYVSIYSNNKHHIFFIGPGLAWVCLGSPAGHLGAKIDDGKTVFGHPLHTRTRVGGGKPCLHQDPGESDPFLWSAVVVGDDTSIGTYVPAVERAAAFNVTRWPAASTATRVNRDEKITVLEAAIYGNNLAISASAIYQPQKRDSQRFHGKDSPFFEGFPLVTELFPEQIC